MLRSHPPFHTARFFYPTTALFPPRRPSLLPLFSTLSCLPLTLTLTSPYGPSLRRGLRPPPPPLSAGEDGVDRRDPPAVVDREGFARAFEIAALRVPAARCAGLEGRLRGHLLNWPRIRNVARVPGDEVDPEVAGLLREGGGGGDDGGCGDRLEAPLRRARGEDAVEAVLSPVLYREKLVKEFNYRGFVRFRNLAKMSRPKKKKKSRRKEEEEEEGEGADAKSRRGKREFSIVEVVRVCGDEGMEDDEEEGLSGLLGEGFAGGRWRGSTRLLLLDERYANKGVEELPEAVKVA